MLGRGFFLKCFHNSTWEAIYYLPQTSCINDQREYSTPLLRLQHHAFSDSLAVLMPIQVLHALSKGEVTFCKGQMLNEQSTKGNIKIPKGMVPAGVVLVRTLVAGCSGSYFSPLWLTTS